MTAELRVVEAGPLVTFQDDGRPRHMRFGVPASGAMDRLSFAAANVAIGNDAGATGIEVSLGGLAIEASAGSVTVAVTGGDFVLEHNGKPRPGWLALTLHQGDLLRIRSGDAGTWAYLASAGQVRAHTWLGSAATHSMSGLGGGSLSPGDRIIVDNPQQLPGRDGEIPRPAARDTDTPVRVVAGPQTRHFEPGAIERLTSSTYTYTGDFDRMGVRLDGPPLPLAGALSIPSEAIVCGSIQVDGQGVPAILLADHQTTGGYPKVATVISSDIDVCAQRRPGDTIDFAAIEPDQAVDAARAEAVFQKEYLQLVAGPGRTLNHRLAFENLISGVQGPD